MLVVYTYSEARQNLTSLLDKAAQEGEVRIKRRDSPVFVIRPEPNKESPLDVTGIDLDLGVPEILQAIRDGRGEV
jgi:prevent-host-death family protein